MLEIIGYIMVGCMVALIIVFPIIASIVFR